MFCKKSDSNPPLSRKTLWTRILIWVLAAAACGYLSFMTRHQAYYYLPGYTTQAFYHTCAHYHTCAVGTVELEPEQTLTQQFTARGNLVGTCRELYLQVLLPQQDAAGSLSVALYSEEDRSVLVSAEEDLSAFPADGTAAFVFPEAVTTLSGKGYRLEVANHSDTVVSFRSNASLQSGRLTVDGQEIPTLVNFGFLRTSNYSPSSLFTLMLILTNVTVLGGLALVLFGNVKEHILYFLLAVGFGIVTLFDLTSLYGFDMQFQFDSIYVVSNQLLGMEGAISSPSLADPGVSNVHYYRRAGDDYSLYQRYNFESVSDNYTDTVAGLKSPRASEAEQELRFVESYQGIVGEQLYLYLPQALGFTAARLLGLGYFPMMLAGRIASYALFVILVFFAIRALPFGKRLMLILALMPTTLTQTVSINRDATILSLCFFLIAKVLQAAYAEKKPSARTWVLILGLSALLAPCKMVYLPVSFFWLLIIYRQYISGQDVSWRKIALRVIGFSLPILGFFVLANLPSLAKMSQGASAGSAGTEVFSLTNILADPAQAFFVLINTFRTTLGTYLVNAIQLFEIDLGSSDSMTLLILFLLLVESLHPGTERQKIQPVERSFFFLVAFGVFLLVTLAAFQWTSLESSVIEGIQGRYLTPVLILLCMSFMNSRSLRLTGNPEVFVKGCCCIFPAVYLMNMYLWTIAR